ncbi:hypothetical protein LKD70_09210 [Ruminococcus sp. CLA-AA-H200]|uniref:Uncharacterized protein n=1 Tax=Ruminococcus turbiniformis TaxID=2881258 RepID=A0ABS8FZ53_9FIRM|nr:hypothetical protein [Ruminococcus turbiniformis]MCC2254593.1 hypothetical protein [Ruminococcus turbiniformis]
MGELTINEAALLLCIFGVPTEEGTRSYPTVEESLNYMKTGHMKYLPETHHETQGQETTGQKKPAMIQMELFA